MSTGLGIGAIASALMMSDVPLLVAALAVMILSLGYDMTQALLAGIVTAIGVKFWHGHRQNPLTRAELEGKFMALATMCIPSEAAQRLLTLVNHLERVEDTGQIMELLNGYEPDETR